MLGFYSAGRAYFPNWDVILQTFTHMYEKRFYIQQA